MSRIYSRRMAQLMVPLVFTFAAGCSSDANTVGDPPTDASVTANTAESDSATQTEPTDSDEAGTTTPITAAGDTTSVTGANPDPTDPDPGEPDPGDALLFDEATVHSITLTFDQSDYDEMIATYREESDKTWIEADVTIDGTTYRQAGLRLKGNSSLFGIGGRPGGPGGGPIAPGDGAIIVGGPEGAEPLSPECAAALDELFRGAAGQPPTSGGDGAVIVDIGPAGPGAFGPGGSASAAQPETLPWLIRLDKFIEDQNHQGHTDLVVRSNPSSTALNEALALDLLDEAGLASQQAAMVRLDVNGGEARLRLVIELPNDEWQDEAFGTGGKLYKADAQGDYSYRGDDPAEYSDAWEQEGGADDLTPLIGFLEFVNESTDEEFNAGLGERLDVEAFARYLAIEDLFENFDDIDGPGNNSYLQYDSERELFTVVAWDHNLAFSDMPFGGPGEFGAGGPAGVIEGAVPVGPGGGGGGGIRLPDDFDPSQLPEGCTLPFPGGGIGSPVGPGGFPGIGRNELVRRFNANPAFKALYDDALADLRAELFTSGTADETLDHWAAVINDGASDLIDADAVTAEADAIRDVIEPD